MRANVTAALADVLGDDLDGLASELRALPGCLSKTSPTPAPAAVGVG